MAKRRQWRPLIAGSLVIVPIFAAAGCKRIQQNEEQLAQAQRTVQRLADIQEIQNLMNKHLYYYATGQRQRDFDEVWANKTNGYSWGNDGGYWVDIMEFKPYYLDYFEKVSAKDRAAGKNPTAAALPQITAPPIIQLSGDGYTAQGLWRALVPSERPGGASILETYGVDFYRRNPEPRPSASAAEWAESGWRILHFFVHREGAVIPATAPPPAPPNAPKPTEGPPPPAVRPSLDQKHGPFEPSGFLKVPHPYYALSLTFNYGPPDNR